jgi:hypothetical protein
MKRMLTLLAVTAATLVVTQAASADVVAIHRTGTTVYAGPDISAVFKGAITVYTDASTGQDMVDDVSMWSVNQTEKYRNWGASPTVAGDVGLVKFKLSQLPGFVGGHINKAELQMYFTGGNTNPAIAQVTTQNWSEGNKIDGFPGAPTAMVGASWAHPNGLNTSSDQAADGTPSVGAASWGVAGNAMFNAASDISGVTFGGVYGFNYTGTQYSGDGTYDGTVKWDVTQVVQAWADGTANYGFGVQPGNIGFTLTEAGGDYQPVLFIDYTPNDVPTAITNLAAGAADWYKVDLTWTAPSDVPSGPVNHYEVRYSTSTITAGNWSSATLVSNPPTPANPGTAEAFTVTGLSASTTYYFAIKSFDSTGLVSALSNVVSKTTGAADVTAPAAVSTLAIADTRPNSVTVTWTSPGDDNSTGTAAQYDIRYSTSTINAGNFASATAVAGEPTPLVAGSLQSMKVTGLSASTTYYFAIKAADEVPNWAAISNVVSTTTLAADTQAPNAISDLGVATTGIKTVSLHWTTPADNGTAGLSSYEVRYSTSTITAGNWSSATVASNPPTPTSTGDPVNMMISGLTANTTYYFAVKSTDQAAPANTSAISNVVSGTTQPPIQPVTVHNPWLKNDRVADTHNITTMGQTYVNSYTPNGVVTPADNQAKAINVYDNQKRRLYHWGMEPPSLPGYGIEDPTYTQNIFGWCLCGRHSANATTITNAAGLGQRRIALPGHWIYEAYYDGAYHALDTMCTMWVKNRASPAKLASCADMVADTTLLANASADGRACPGLLLCGDTIPDYQGMLNGWSDSGSYVVTTAWTGNMDLRIGQSFKRTWESWLNQHPTSAINADSLPGNDPPYHHEANKDYKDTVNLPYWEPYAFNSTQNAALNIGHSVSYRRWANGTDTLAPDFRSAGYQAMLYSSSNIKTYNDDQLTPDLHVNAVGSPAEVVFKIYLPYYITDANISGTFYRHDTGDVNKILISTDGNYYTQVWDNQASGTTQLNNLNLRNYMFATMTYYVKVQLQADGSITDAGVSNLVIATTFEHNKGCMAYLDKGTNNLTFTFDNPADLVGSSTTVHIYYKWKEYDGADWTVDKSYETYTTTSPTNFTINVGGTKVPRTEYILVELVPTPAPDGTAPMSVTNLTVSRGGSVCADLNWTAPGDDWDTGTATSYDIRYSTSLITAGNWASATQVTGEPTPKAAGQAETFQVRGLNPNTTYYFAIKTSDEVPNVSGLSNVASVTTDPADSTAPAAITNLTAAAGGTQGSILLTWTAPGDDGNTGTARTYDIRYSTSLINAGNFASATAVSSPPTPSVAGSNESVTIYGVPTGVMYYFAIKTSDEVPNVSALSNVPSAKSVLGDMWFQNGVNGCTCCGDSYMSAAAVTTNYDGYDYMITCGFSDQASTNRRRGIVKFNLSGLVPTNAAITQAKLYVYAYANEQHDAAGGYYGAYRVQTSWTPSAVTWNMPWTVSGGGDLEATPDYQAAKQTTTGVWYVFDVTSRVQDFIANPGNNNGWVIKCTNEQMHNQDYFYTSEASTVSLRPKLFITDVGNVITTACSPTNGGSVSGGGTFDSGQTCTLTATGTGQFVFNHWSGAPVDGSTSNPVGFTVNSSATITAVFTSTDVTAPAAIANLAATVGSGTGTVNLTWTAPGDDDNTGTAYAYDVRYSTSLITAGNFASATAVSGIGAPKAAGQAEAYSVSGLTNGTLYYFAVKTRDEVPNWSGLSNVISATPVMGDRIFQNGLSSYTGGNDSYINAAAATTNYGTNTRMTVCGYADQGATNVQRGLVKFDVTSIPTSTTITRATLYLYSYQVAGSSGYYGAYPLTRAFTDTTATWNTYDGTNAWTTAGGDFNSTADGTSAKQSVAGVWYAFDVTSRVQQWITTPSANYGWVIKCTDENLHNQDLFYTSDYATDTTLRPKLVVSDMTGFMVSTAASPTSGGTISGGGNFQSGQTCTLTAYPDTSFGFVFDHWSGGSVNGLTTNPVSFSVTGDVTVTAVFQGPAGYIDVSNYTQLKTAIQTTAVAGNTIRVHSGTYPMPETHMDLNKAGNVGQPITVIGVGPTRPILTAPGQNVDRGFFYINPTDSNWVFENLEFQNIYDTVGTNAAAAYIQGSNVTFRNCKIHDCDQGFSSTTTAANTLIEYCEVYNCNSSINPGYSHLLYMMSDSLTVRGCYLHDALHGQLFKSRSNNNTIEYNWMENEGTESMAAGIASGNSNNTLMRGNVIIKKSAAGGQRGVLYFYDTSGSMSGTVTLINNTIISTATNDACITHNTGSTANIVLKNNIFAGTSDTLFVWNVSYSQLSGTNNAFKPAMSPVPSQLLNNYYPADPGFVNLAGRDLHLLSSSACVNIGQNGPTYLNYSGATVNGTPANEPNKTLTLATRFVDSTLDTGAYEYAPPVPSVQFQAASSSGSEATTSVNLPVTLSSSFGSTVTVSYAVTGGSATGGGVDYTLASGVVTFTSGQTSQNIPVTIVNDSLNENDETIVVTLSSPVNAVLGLNTSHTYTVTDNDTAPTVQFVSTSSSGTESVASVNLAVQLSAASGKTVTVNYAATGGTATNPADYTIAGTSLTFNAGETSKNVPVTVVDDTTSELNETIIITLSGPSNATLGTNTAHTYTINDNDVPTVQFSQASSSGSEATTSVTIPVTLSASSGSTVTVNYAVTGGTASGSGTDYTLAAGQLTFTSGQTSQNVPVTVVNDTMDEDDETIVITLSSPVNATLGANTAHTYTITDDDNPPTVQFTATTSSGAESVASVNLAVSLGAASGKTVTVNYAATGGTAANPADYTISGTSLTFNPGVTSQNVPITVVDDTADELSETIVVTLSGPTNASLGTNTTHTYTITDNEGPPAAIADLAAGSPTSASITLTWTAPGDDGSVGTATTYDIRYSTSTINEGNWASATQASGEPTPQVAGTVQNMVVSGLNSGTTYYFAMKTSDEVPNTSAISNVASGTTGSAGPLQVGPGKTYSTVQAAVNAAIDGDTIEIYPSTYTQSAGWATINKNNLTLRGMGTRPVIDAAGSCLSSKGIFIITGANATIENIELKNTTNPTDKNAAGIRLEAAGLTVRNCYIHDNDDGILTNSGIGGNILIETSEFNHNGYGNGSSHQMYINPVDSLTVRYCYIHNANVGHEIKTRAAVNYILYNRIGNEGGNGSYEIQPANGGTTYIIGNQIEQSSTTSNSGIINYATEGTSADNHLYVVNNTIVNNRSAGCTFVYNASTTDALLQNNIFQGAGTVLSGPGTQTTNWAATDAYLVNAAGYDFHLTTGSTGAIDAGTMPSTGINGFNMNPTLQYVHPCSCQSRPTGGTIDIGGYDFAPPAPSVQFSATSSSGSEATTPANLTVTLSSASSNTVTVQYNVTGGTATEGTDYTLPTTPVGGIVAFKRSPGLTDSRGVASVFANAVTGATITVYSGAGMIADAPLYIDTGWAQSLIYVNGGADTASPTGAQLLLKYGLGSLPGFAGSTINKAELRFFVPGGNTGNADAGYITFSDWTEGNKTGVQFGWGDYPGLAPAAPGVTGAAPSAVNTGAFQWPDGTQVDVGYPYNMALAPFSWANGQPWGDTKDAVKLVTGALAHNPWNISGDPQYSGCDQYITLDVTSIVQVWAGGQANYGMFMNNFGNYGPWLSEETGAADYQPVLFIDYTGAVASNVVTFDPGQTSKVIPITIIDDAAVESNETIQVTLSNPTNATLGANTIHTYTINDNDLVVPTVQFQAATSSGSEATTSVNIPVTLSTSTTATVTVNYAVTGGSATGSGTDYTLASGQLTFNPSVTSQNIPVTINNDSLDELDETIIVTLSSPTNATLGTTTSHTYTVNDDDPTPTVAFSAASSNGSEATTAVNLAVTLSAASGQTVTVSYAATGGSATSPADYTIGGTSLTFNPGETSKNVPITVVDDALVEGSETIIVTLSNPTNATLGANTTHTYTITDNDVPTVQFSATSSNASEATTSVNLAVTLSASSSQTVTVSYAVSGGTATGSGTDYTITGTQLTFNPGVTSQNVPITVVNDALDETNETIIVTLSSPTNATLGANTTHTYTINDDDAAPTVAFSAASSSGSEATTSVNLAVTLSAASGQTVTVNYAATGGTATGGGTDYTLTAGTLTFNPGVTSQNVPITVVNDSLVESNETIIVTLSSPTNATLGANTTHTYTINDNDTAPTFVAAGTVASGTGAITPALPAGLQANDILLLFVETANQTISITNQNGGTWTQVTGSPQGTGTAGGTAATSLTVFWSRYNGTQGAPTTSDSGDHQLGRMIAIRGATTSGNPWDVTAGGVEATADTSGSIAGATTTVANALVVVAIATSLPDASSTAKFSGWTNADLSSLTERTDNTVTAGNGGGLAIATGGKASAGAYGATTVTLVNAAAKGMMSIALKP